MKICSESLGALEWIKKYVENLKDNQRAPKQLEILNNALVEVKGVINYKGAKEKWTLEPRASLELLLAAEECGSMEAKAKLDETRQSKGYKEPKTVDPNDHGALLKEIDQKKAQQYYEFFLRTIRKKTPLSTGDICQAVKVLYSAVELGHKDAQKKVKKIKKSEAYKKPKNEVTGDSTSKNLRDRVAHQYRSCENVHARIKNALEEEAASKSAHQQNSVKNLKGSFLQSPQNLSVPSSHERESERPKKPNLPKKIKSEVVLETPGIPLPQKTIEPSPVLITVIETPQKSEEKVATPSPILPAVVETPQKITEKGENPASDRSVQEDKKEKAPVKKAKDSSPSRKDTGEAKPKKTLKIGKNEGKVRKTIQRTKSLNSLMPSKNPESTGERDAHPVLTSEDKRKTLMKRTQSLMSLPTPSGVSESSEESPTPEKELKRRSSKTLERWVPKTISDHREASEETSFDSRDEKKLERRSSNKKLDRRDSMKNLKRRASKAKLERRESEKKLARREASQKTWEIPPITLENYGVLLKLTKETGKFFELTGTKLDKNINRKQVIDLLVALGCSITQAGGSHEKATAPNKAEWTIPPEWDGPIPSRYRKQLSDFFVEKMDIDPKTVPVKCVDLS